MFPYIQIIIPSYLFMAFIGIFTAVIYLSHKVSKIGVSFSSFVKLLIGCMFGGFLGSKFLYFITGLPTLIDDFSIQRMVLSICNSGYVYYGGLLGVLISLYLLTRKDTNLAIEIFNCAAPAIALFHGFGRIGCLLAGCCYGAELSSPIYLGTLILRRIPVQLIESVYEFCLFLCLHMLYKKKKEKLMQIYLLFYGVFRFIIEFFRGDLIRGIWFGLSTSQWISLIILVAIFLHKWKSCSGSKSATGLTSSYKL